MTQQEKYRYSACLYGTANQETKLVESVLIQKNNNTVLSQIIVVKMMMITTMMLLMKVCSALFPAEKRFSDVFRRYIKKQVARKR